MVTMGSFPVTAFGGAFKGEISAWTLWVKVKSRALRQGTAVPRPHCFFRSVAYRSAGYAKGYYEVVLLGVEERKLSGRERFC